MLVDPVQFTTFLTSRHLPEPMLISAIEGLFQFSKCTFLITLASIDSNDHQHNINRHEISRGMDYSGKYFRDGCHLAVISEWRCSLLRANSTAANTPVKSFFRRWRQVANNANLKEPEETSMSASLVSELYSVLRTFELSENKPTELMVNQLANMLHQPMEIGVVRI